MTPDPLLLPPATRLVHIGPFKTGTTSIQGALDAARDQLGSHGVHFACREGETQPMWAVLAVTGKNALRGSRTPQPEDWTELLDGIRDAGDRRVILSSEFFSDAEGGAVDRVLEEIPGGPVHVVVTLRPLAKIAPSQWQQHVQNGLRTPYVEWLTRLFDETADDHMTRVFWRRHDHGALVRRWAEAVGHDNLTVVLADESAPDMMLRTFESLLGLPTELLAPVRKATNRSLLAGEVEIVRQLNEAFHRHGRSGAWSDTAYKRLIRNGAIPKMKTGRAATPDLPKLVTPQWALKRAGEMGAAAAEEIRSLGVRVVGDLEQLGQVPDNGVGDDAHAGPPSLVPVDAAAFAVLGAIHGPGVPNDGEKVAAALSTMGMEHDFGGDGEFALIPVEAAVRAVSAVIEGRDTISHLNALPAVPAQLAALTSVASARAGDSDGETAPPDPAEVRRVAGALGVEPKTKSKPKKHKKTPVKDPEQPPVEQLPVAKVTAKELLGVVAQRGQARIRRRIRR